MILNDLGQHHRTLLKKLIRATDDQNYGQMVINMLAVCEGLSDLRRVRRVVEGWCEENEVE